MPFLVDSTTMEINRQGLSLLLTVHPILVVQRDAQGRLQTVTARRPGTGQDPALRESWMHVEVDRLVDEAQREQLLGGLQHVLRDVRVAVSDWPAMLAVLHEAIGELEQAPSALPAEPIAEYRAFLQWLADDNFTLLGYRRHDLVEQDGDDVLRLVQGSGLGVLRESALDVSASFAAVPAAARAMARSPMPALLVTRSNSRSTVHRPGYTDYVGVKRYNAAGEVIGEHRFVGLFTSTAYSEPVAGIPLLRGKVEAVRQRAGLPAGGHLSKALDHILATYPRDDLFQIDEDDLFHITLGILAASEPSARSIVKSFSPEAIRCSGSPITRVPICCMPTQTSANWPTSTRSPSGKSRPSTAPSASGVMRTPSR
jgi:glutamate dehydrogenase